MLTNKVLHSHLYVWVFTAHLFKGLWHAAVYEPLAVLISISKTWQRGKCWIHKFMQCLKMDRNWL